VTDPRIRTKEWTCHAPGLYLDPDGFIHIFPDEICAELEIEYTPENYRMIVETFTEDMPRILGRNPLQTKIIQHVREPES
jgi:hypothetical protein